MCLLTLSQGPRGWSSRTGCLRRPGQRILEKAWCMHHRNTYHYFGGGRGSRGQINVEGARHLPFILLPGMWTPMACVRSEIVMHLMYILQWLALSSLPIVIPLMLENAFMSDWSWNCCSCGDHWCSTHIFLSLREVGLVSVGANFYPHRIHPY